MLADLVRFNREARELVGRNGGGPSLREFLAERRYSPYFVERLIVPQVSAIWSADPAELWSFPASFIAEFFANHGALQLRGRPRWRSVTRRIEALRRGADAAVSGIACICVRRCGGSSATRPASTLRLERRQRALRPGRPRGPLRPGAAMLADPSPAEREVLGAIPYQPNETVLHTDAAPAPPPPRREGELELPPHASSRPGGRRSPTT